MKFFLKFIGEEGEKHVPIGDFGNREDAIRELKKPLYEKIIQAHKEKLFLIKRKPCKKWADRIRFSRVPLKVKDEKGVISIEVNGKYEPDNRWNQLIF